MECTILGKCRAKKRLRGKKERKKERKEERKKERKMKKAKKASEIKWTTGITEQKYEHHSFPQ